ncbi:tetratricopeptide repeat protein, partial [Corynebacterium stationis]
REWNNERQDRQGRGDWKSRGENDRGRRSDGRPGSSRGNWREDRNDRDERRGGGDRREGGRRDWQSRGERGGDNRDNRRGDRRNDERRGDSRGRGHANRGGRAEQERAGRNLAPQRSGFREERINRRMADPDLPDDIDINDLDPLILQDLRVLSKDNAEETAKHMIMAAEWMEDDPQLALRHARAAKDRAGRVAVAREVNGIAAYHAGEWKEALAELRAARRISGGPGMLAVMADCERGLGRPEKAIELGRSEEAQQVDAETAIELAIVVAGARQDLGQNDSAVVTLQRANPSKDAKGIPAMRLSYAYANALAEAGRKEEAKEWFEHTAKLDVDQWTDAHERLKEF